MRFFLHILFRVYKARDLQGQDPRHDGMPTRRKRAVGPPTTKGKQKNVPEVPLEKRFCQLDKDQRHLVCADLVNCMWLKKMSLATDEEFAKKIQAMKERTTRVVRENEFECVDLVRAAAGEQFHVHTATDFLKKGQVAIVFLADIFGDVKDAGDLCMCYVGRFISEAFDNEIVGTITAERVLLCFTVHRVDKFGTHYIEVFDSTEMSLPLIAANMVEQECCICFTTINERVACKGDDDNNEDRIRYCGHLLLSCPK